MFSSFLLGSLVKRELSRERLRDCYFNKLSHTILPSRRACHLPLHKGGFFLGNVVINNNYACRGCNSATDSLNVGCGITVILR